MPAADPGPAPPAVPAASHAQLLDAHIQMGRQKQCTNFIGVWLQSCACRTLPRTCNESVTGRQASAQRKKQGMRRCCMHVFLMSHHTCTRWQVRHQLDACAQPGSPVCAPLHRKTRPSGSRVSSPICKCADLSLRLLPPTHAYLHSPVMLLPRNYVMITVQDGTVHSAMLPRAEWHPCLLVPCKRRAAVHAFAEVPSSLHLLQHCCQSQCGRHEPRL